MGFNLEGQTCPVCHAYLFDEDDIVFCPVCGAPHHRDCYNKIGHCGLAELHGTDEEYDRSKFIKQQTEKEKRENTGTTQIECIVCHEKYEKAQEKCPHCGAPNVSDMNARFVSFDFLGGVPADYNIGEGVTADEAKRFVGTNTPRYVRKFSVLTKKNKASWNWLAFLFPGCWYLTRKMYLKGVIFTCIELLSQLLMLPFANSLPEITSYNQYMQSVYSAMQSADKLPLALCLLGSVAMLALRIICGITADYSYKNHTIKNILDIKENSEDKDFDFRKRGGISVLAMTIGLAINCYGDYIVNYLYKLFG